MRVQKEITLECSINLHKRTYGIKFKNRVSRAVREIKKFAQKATGINNVRIDTNLNKELCKNGSRNIPFKIKVRLFKKHCVSEKGNDLWVVFVNSQKSFFRI
mmetsp:Transcript_8015/g.15959  ORF Transcript_8015/g.15959 Transcript_8015/m.15959 type:complete len:102 (-) Transcript_8015:2551-2856(-)